MSPIVEENRHRKIKECEHVYETEWSPMFGEEHLLEPDYDYCVKCKTKQSEIFEIEGR